MRKYVQQKEQRLVLVLPKEKARKLIADQISEGKAIMDFQVRSEVEYEEFKRKFLIWRDYSSEILKSIANTDELERKYSSSLLFARVSAPHYTFSNYYSQDKNKLKSAIVGLESVHKRIELIQEINEEKTEKQVERISREVFIVHGHDKASKQSVARCIEQLELDPIIMQEQPNQGRTLIEKLESSGEAGYAVIILTPDDVGGEASNPQNLKFRARQNVILEFGYFIGRLGRNRVCALHKGDVELPSDIHGVAWITLDDSDAWRLAIVKELRGAGYNVDANKL